MGLAENVKLIWCWFGSGPLGQIGCGRGNHQEELRELNVEFVSITETRISPHRAGSQ